MPGGFVAGILWETVSPNATFGFAASLTSIAFILLATIGAK
jgi:hypothetical protein